LEESNWCACFANSGDGLFAELLIDRQGPVLQEITA
jgi:hypothetical protein